jgi:hypothetical protein
MAAFDINVDWGMEDIVQEGKEGIIDTAKTLGVDKVLRIFNNEASETDKKKKPDFWTDNKKWIIPAGIGTGALVVVALAMAAGTKKKR